MGLKSKPRTGPVCVVFRSISDSEVLNKFYPVSQRWLSAIDKNTHSAPARILAGSHNTSSPFSKPAAMTPFGRPSTPPQASRLNLSVATISVSIATPKRARASTDSPRRILHSATGPLPTHNTQLKLISVHKIGRPDLELALIAERFVQGACNCSGCDKG